MPSWFHPTTLTGDNTSPSSPQNWRTIPFGYKGELSLDQKAAILETEKAFCQADRFWGIGKKRFRGFRKLQLRLARLPEISLLGLVKREMILLTSEDNLKIKWNNGIKVLHKVVSKQFINVTKNRCFSTSQILCWLNVLHCTKGLPLALNYLGWSAEGPLDFPLSHPLSHCLVVSVRTVRNSLLPQLTSRGMLSLAIWIVLKPRLNSSLLKLHYTFPPQLSEVQWL